MWKFAFRNLLNRPIRSLLALLGLTVAIAGMVGLFSVAEGLDNMVDDTFSQIPGLVVMQPGAPIPLFSRLPAKWENELSQLNGVGVVNPELWTRVNMVNEKGITTPPRFLFGTDIEKTLKLKKSLYRNALEAGRFLNPSDKGTYNTVISRQIAEEFHVAVGETLQVNGFDLTIVGIYHFGNLLVDVAIIVDINQVRQMARFDKGLVSSFYVEPDGTIEGEELAKDIRNAFRHHTLDSWSPSASSSIVHQLTGSLFLQTMRDFFQEMLKDSPDSPSANPQKRKKTPVIEVRSASDWADKFKEFSSDLDIILTLLTSIGVVIAVLSIINTMLMSVSERIIEFGILKANGWSRSDVLKLITLESFWLGLCGGFLGSLIGWVATQVVNAQFPMRMSLYASPSLLLFALFFSTILGVAGGMYPAFWAMRMMPMDAIRRG
ncbi:ABC transporter permease protein [hydrothermal vent metagenome]|uniref:ABC transporter permease protein n=1 Tax=hydrothermal vent metagenome TaxID=652676 RepID=A0A3B1D949_9ZZZZ